MSSTNNRQPVWVTNLFEKVTKPIRAKFLTLSSHGLPAADGDVLFEAYIQELAKGVREAVCDFHNYLSLFNI